MTTTLLFEAPIRVVGYQRAHAVGGKRIKPAATRRCMQVIKLAAQVARRETIEAGTWASITIRVHYSTAVRPDLDNAVKTVLDALTGVAWQDDRQVEQLDAKLIQCDRDYLYVAVRSGGKMGRTPPGKRARVAKKTETCQDSICHAGDDLLKPNDNVLRKRNSEVVRVIDDFLEESAESFERDLVRVVYR